MKRSKNDNKSPKENLAKDLGLEVGVDPFDWVWEELEDYEVAADLERGALSVKEALWYARRSLRRYNRAREENASSPGQREKQKQVRRVQDIPVELTGRERDATDALRNTSQLTLPGDPWCKGSGGKTCHTAGYSRETPT